METKIKASWNLREIEEIKKIKDNVFLVKTEKNMKYILKEKKNLDNLILEDDLLSFLNKDFQISSQIIETINNEKYIEINKKYFSLYNYIEGKSLELFKGSDDISILINLGKAIGLLHKNLIGYKDKFNKINDLNLKDSLFNWAIPQILKLNDNSDLINKIKLIESDIKNLYEKLDIQFIHRDPHADNIIFNNNKFSAWIDFELCTKGFKGFDIAYLMTGILMSNFEDESIKKFWIENFNKIISGYKEINSISNDEIDSLWYIMLSIQLTFIAYFYKSDNIDLVNANINGFNFIYSNKTKICQKLTVN